MKQIPAEWAATRRKLETALENYTAGSIVPESLRQTFRDAAGDNQSADKNVYLFGQLDADKMVALAKAEVVAWWPLVSGRAYFNDLEGLRKVFAAVPSERKTSLASGALAWVAEPHKIAEGVENSPNAALIRQLLEWKADPNDDGGKWLQKSLRALDADSIHALVESGASPVTVFRVMDELLKEKKYEQAGRIQQALSKGTMYFKIDDHTLMESKFIPAADGGASFKALFNFRSRRVNEIYETTGPEKRTTMTSVGFDDYDDAAIGFAEEQLRRLGGTPPDALGKPRLAKLGAQKP